MSNKSPVLVMAIVAGVLSMWPGLAKDNNRGARRLPAGDQPQMPGVHREVPRDQPAPPALLRRRLTEPARAWSRGPFTSVQVNVDSLGSNIIGDAANEPSLAIVPDDPHKMVIGWRQFDSVTSDFRQSGYGYSRDGGQTWTFPGVLEPGVFSSDPVLNSDLEGNIYYYALQAQRGPGSWACYMYRTSDAGLTWNQGVYAYGGDKPWVTVDQTTGPGSGNIYVSWSPQYGCCDGIFTRSTDRGVTWMEPISLPRDLGLGTLTVDPEGDLYVAGWSWNVPFPAFVVARSSSAQLPYVPSFESVTEVDLGGTMVAHLGWLTPNPVGLLGQVWIAADHSDGPTRGYVYLLCSVMPDDESDPLDVMFARSTDGGLTWSAPLRVNDDPMGNNAWQWFATMSVAPDGRIDAVWNDTRNTGAANLSEVFYSFSTDAGVTWSGNIPISPVFDSHVGWPQQDKLGDYYHMISDNDGVNLAYAATFNGEQDVYFVRIEGDCNENAIDDDCDVECGPAGSRCDVPGCGAGDDCNHNNIPDECEADEDCNNNGIQDICDIAGGTSDDCNWNDVPNECELADNDCNGNGIHDDCEMADEDCNDNGVRDWCDILDGTSEDCTGNEVPDECEPDCNENGIADSCDIAGGTSRDCNENGVPAECEIGGDCVCVVTEQQKVNAPDAEEREYFGTAVSMSAGWAIVGAKGEWYAGEDSGLAYMYRLDDNGTPLESGDDRWVLQTRLTLGGLWTRDYFGTAVSMSGDWAIVGAPNKYHAGIRPGAAYVFQRSGTVWSSKGRLMAIVPVESDRFGYSVAINGDLAIVGAPGKKRWDYDLPGSATVFRLSDNGTPSEPSDDRWRAEAELTAADAIDERNYFGGSVAIGGDRAVVGAPMDDDPTYRSGAAYVFRHSDNNTPLDPADDFWLQEAKLIPADIHMYEYFGWSVSIAGDRVVVGAWGNNEPSLGVFAVGAAYVFRHSDNGTPADPNDDFWLEEAKLTPSDPSQELCLGFAVFSDGKRVIAGAIEDYLYPTEPKLIPSDPSQNLDLGRADFRDGQRVIAGAIENDQDEGPGAAYVFELDPALDMWIETLKLTASDGAIEDHFGSAVAFAGNRIVVGAPDDDDAGHSSGSAYFFDIGSDCNSNGVFDECEVAYPGNDCNGNGVLDACDVTKGTSQDDNCNGIPDECDTGDDPDCNGNGKPDACDIAEGTSKDCNDNGNPDECDLSEGGSHDCNENCVPDECETDCNGNDVPDDCDIAGDTAEDCNNNGVPDECDIADTTSEDCNQNGIPDDCDIAHEPTIDENNNGIPDECETPSVIAEGCRYVAVMPQLSLTAPVALMVTSPDHPCLQTYARADGRFGATPVFQTAEQWGTVHVHGQDIVPEATYEVRAEFEDGSLSGPAGATTARWGDTIGRFIDGAWTPPNGSVDIIDAAACVDRFRHLPTAPPLEWCDLYPMVPDGRIDILDIVPIIDAFRGFGYPYALPCP
ncbi:MAG: hypothetical protein JSU86_13625 [Phycisphaerales bacterium]|nr:MAG: hypothetical protein JSU86_13625 [Phycisphaerales bacterium]